MAAVFDSADSSDQLLTKAITFEVNQTGKIFHYDVDIQLTQQLYFEEIIWLQKPFQVILVEQEKFIYLKP